MNKLELISLDGLKIFLKGTRVEGQLSKKSKGLLMYMIAMSTEIPRERLSELFWEESSMSAARNNLRHAIWEINKLDGNEIVKSSRENCYINESYEVYSDIGQLESIYKDYREVDLKELKSFMEIYKVDFLDGIYYKNSITLNDWILMQRNYYQKIHYEIIGHIGDRFLEREEYDLSLWYYEKLLMINPLHEYIYLKIMRNRIQADKPVQAIKYYKDCMDTLRKELGIDPGEDLQELYSEIVSKRENLNIEDRGSSMRLNEDIPQRNLIIDGESFFDYELCSRLTGSILENIQLNQLTEEDLYRVSFLHIIYPSSKFDLTVDKHVKDNIQLDSCIYQGLMAMVKLVYKSGIKLFINNFDQADGHSKKIIKAIEKQDKLNNKQTLVLN